MRLVHLLGPAIALSSLSACEAVPPSISTADIATFNSETARTAALPVTSVAALPVGTVTYFGEFASNADVEGIGDAMFGDLEMSVDFASQRIGGTLSNINLIEGGQPQQRMGGELDLSGIANDGIINASADGLLTRVDANKTDYANTTLLLDGSVRNDRFVGDAIAGTVTGSGRGSFDFDLDGNGTFYGSALQ